MKLPWKRPEKPTEKRGYTDRVTEALISQAAQAVAGQSGAQEIAAGTVSRAFASAEASGSDAALFTADVLGQIGRDLVTSGDSVWRTGLTRLVYVHAYQITPMDDGTYRYQVDTPNGKSILNRPLHVRYAREYRTGRGIGPLGAAVRLREFIARLEDRMAFESGGTVGYLLPIPAGGEDEDVEVFKADLAKLGGKTAVVETTAAGWGEGRAAAPQRDYEPRRIGPNIPSGNVQAYGKALESALAACGVPVELVSSADGTAQREAWRRFLHGTVQPLGKLVEQAASDAGLGLSLGFDGLMASDISGRARAFGSLVQGGMDMAEAAGMTGLLGDE